MSLTAFNGFNFGKVQTQNVAAGGGAVGGWVELGRTTLGSSSDTISVSSLADKRYYMVLGNYLNSGAIRPIYRCNSDSGNNYVVRRSVNGAADATNDTTAQMYLSDHNSNYSSPTFAVGYFANYSTKEKLCVYHDIGQNSAGAGTAPQRNESVGKWSNTSNAISAFNIVNDQSGDFASGSEVIVLGYDPSDTHTTNFWEELASVDLSGGVATTLSSGTITAKKYLWVQIYISSMASVAVPRIRFNGDSGSNYAIRLNYNGTEESNINMTNLQLNASTYTTPFFINMFIINNSANEKLLTGNCVQQGAAGAGNAPDQRTEFAHKWSNTSSQITSILLLNSASTNMGTNTIMKIWGSN